LLERFCEVFDRNPDKNRALFHTMCRMLSRSGVRLLRFCELLSMMTLYALPMSSFPLNLPFSVPFFIHVNAVIEEINYMPVTNHRF
jgi:hypothetical protein